MNASQPTSTWAQGDADPLLPHPLSDQAWARVASWVISSLEPGERTNARAVLAAHPMLALNQNAVLRLALEEFSQALSADERPDVDDYVARFPEVAERLQRDLELLLIMRESSDSAFRFTSSFRELWPEEQTEFAGWQLMKQLGGGSDSRVFLARQLESQQNRILKLCRSPAKEIMVREAIQSERIVPIEATLHDPQWPLTGIVMPILGQETLQGVYETAWRMHRAPRQLGSLQAIARSVCAAGNRAIVPDEFSDFLVVVLLQVARALQVLHDAGYVHGDIKPANLLLGNDGIIRLFDFDLAHQVGGEFLRLGGTPQFTAPEHLRRLSMLTPSNQDQKADPRMDLFAFGAMSYLLASGRFPFGWIRPELTRAEATCALLERQRIGPRPLRQLNPDINRATARLIHACLAFQPEQRPNSMQQVVQELERLGSWRAHSVRAAQRWFDRAVSRLRPTRDSIGSRR